MPQVSSTLGQAQLDIILVWGRRRKGVCVPEVVEHFDIPHLAAWRAIQRLVKRGRLFKITDRKRRRAMLFGNNKAGRGADVYKTKPEENDEQAS